MWLIRLELSSFFSQHVYREIARDDDPGPDAAPLGTNILAGCSKVYRSILAVLLRALDLRHFLFDMCVD
jgi:hypothetical protein